MEQTYTRTLALRTGKPFGFADQHWQLLETTTLSLPSQQVLVTALRARALGIETDTAMLLEGAEDAHALAGLQPGSLSFTNASPCDASYQMLFDHLIQHQYFPALVPAHTPATDAFDAASLLDFSQKLPLSYQQTVSTNLTLDSLKEVRLHLFTSPYSLLEHQLLQYGTIDPTTPTLTRIHSACLTGDIFHSVLCDCHDQLHQALAEIKDAQSGVLLYLQQEGRGIGLANKLRAYNQKEAGLDTVQANEVLGFKDDDRSFTLAAHMLHLLGIKTVSLMTNNPRKISGLEACGISVSQRRAHYTPARDEHKHYLDTKRQKLGHLDG